MNVADIDVRSCCSAPISCRVVSACFLAASWVCRSLSRRALANDWPAAAATDCVRAISSVVNGRFSVAFNANVPMTSPRTTNGTISIETIACDRANSDIPASWRGSVRASVIMTGLPSKTTCFVAGLFSNGMRVPNTDSLPGANACAAMTTCVFSSLSSPIAAWGRSNTLISSSQTMVKMACWS